MNANRVVGAVVFWAVAQAVGGAVSGAVGWAVSRDVDQVVYRAAPRAVRQAELYCPSHPALDDFMAAADQNTP